MDTKKITLMELSCKDHDEKGCSLSGNKLWDFAADVVICRECKTIFRDRPWITSGNGHYMEITRVTFKFDEDDRPGFFKRIWNFLTRKV